MDTLPKELIGIISSMIPTDDLVTAFKAVNKSFFAISQSIVTDIGSSFKREQTNNDHQIIVLARDYPSITSLDISKWRISVSALPVVLTKFPRLKTLKLAPLYAAKDSIINFFFQASMQGKEMCKHQVPSVTSLSIEPPSALSQNVGTFDVPAINTIFPNMEHLELRGDPYQSTTDNLLKDIKTVKSLTVYGSSTTTLPNIPLLKTLTIVNNNQTSINIADCPILETLNMKFCNFKKFDFLKQIPNVQHVLLHRGFQDGWETANVQYDYEGLIRNLVTCCRNIKTLRIEYFRITSKHLERLVNELPNLKKIIVHSDKYDDNLPVTAVLLQEKHKDTKIMVSARKFTTGIDADVINDLMKAKKTRDPFVECQYCHLHYQCAPQIHEEVCLKWPAWSCLFMNDGCAKTGMTKEEFRVHIDKCDFNVIKCPIQSCAETIRRHERHEHFKKHEKTFGFRLKETHMFCPNLQYGCMELFSTPADLSNHMSKYQHSHCLCMSCKEEFASIDQCAKHMSECRVTQKRQIVPDECLPQIMEIATKFSKIDRDNNNTYHYSRVYMSSSY